MRKARTKPGYLAALHLGEGDCGAQKRIELASGLPGEQIQDPAEGSEIGENHAVEKAGMPPQGIKHLLCGLGDMHFEGMILHLRTGHGELAHRGVGRRGGCVPARAYGLEVIEMDGVSVIVFTPEETMLRAQDIASFNAAEEGFTLPAALLH